MRKVDCDRCGACCQTFPVLVSEADAQREPRVREYGLELAEFLKRPGWDIKLHPLPFLEGCCFLGENKLCTVYQTRPEVCRSFQAGTDECTEARARVGLPPLEGWEPDAPS